MELQTLHWHTLCHHPKLEINFIEATHIEATHSKNESHFLFLIEIAMSAIFPTHEFAHN